MERERFIDLALSAATLIALYKLSVSAFSRKSRRIIWERDGGVCQESGVDSKHQNLHAAHWNHSRDYPGYNDPENGRLLTTYEHYKDHYYRDLESIGLSENQNRWALNSLWGQLMPWEKKKLPHPETWGTEQQTDFFDMIDAAV